MVKELIKKSIFFVIVYLITLYNKDTFFNNVTTLSIVMLMIHIIGFISLIGSYDTIYYRFGSFFDSIRKEERKQEKYKSFEAYKETLEETRTKMNWFNIIFYATLVLVSFFL